MDKYDAEKDIGVTTLERVDTEDSEVVNEARINAFTEQEQKKILWKIDRRLITTLGFMYTVSLMDRTNLGIAAVGGMAVDLDLIGTRYSIIVLIFFITYVLCQPVATVVLRKAGPRAFLPSIVILWGACMVTFGFVKKWDQMVGLRVILGVFEAGMFPGAVYLLSCWYPRYELQKRNAVFYLIGSMASAFAGILGYGLCQMNGLGSKSLPSWLGQHHYPTKKDPTLVPYVDKGLAGWRWMFIMQGVITCLIGVVGYIFIVNFPELCTRKQFLSPKFLTEDEAAFVVARIEKDRHDALPEEFNLKKYLVNALDLKIWGFAALFGLTTTMTYAIAYFLPIILEEGMGFDVAEAQCLIAPPYVWAAIVMFTMAWLGDKYHIRSPFILINGCMALIGLGLLGFSKNVAVRYFGVFLATGAANANVPCVLTWQANNIRGQWKRALCSATLVGAGGIGGIIGGTVFREQDKPKYIPGISACMGAAGLIVVITLMLLFKFKKANARAQAGGKPIEQLPGFLYTL